MRDRLRVRLAALWRRARRFQHRKRRELRAWAETTSSVVHFSALVFVPLLVAVVTYLSNAFSGLSYLLFPPLASGTYTLFTDPEGKYASPIRFVVGLTTGALCGWAALEISSLLGTPVQTGLFEVSVLGAGLAVLLAGSVTWVLSVEEPSAYATALLGLLVPDQQLAFVASVLLASLLVASVFVFWRDRFYERRAQFLYRSIRGDDHVLVPFRGTHADATATFAARLAAAHDAGKVVLLETVDDAAVARAERDHLRRDGVALAGSADRDDAPLDEDPPEAAEDDVVDDVVAAIEARAADIESTVGIPCEVVVATNGDDVTETVLAAARESNCDLVVAPYEADEDGMLPWLRSLFRVDLDVVVHRSAAGRTRWRRILLPVRRTSEVAHEMLDFAIRLAGRAGSISVCTCIGSTGDRRRAESMLADLVGPFDGPIETRVSRSEIEPFLEAQAGHYDVVFMGASRDRSAASRIIVPPTFERIESLDADVAIVDRSG